MNSTINIATMKHCFNVSHYRRLWTHRETPNLEHFGFDIKNGLPFGVFHGIWFYKIGRSRFEEDDEMKQKKWSAMTDVLSFSLLAVESCLDNLLTKRDILQKTYFEM